MRLAQRLNHLHEASDIEQHTEETFKAQLESSFRSFFPLGYFRAHFSTGFLTSITVRFGLIGEQSDVSNNIRENDPMYHVIIVRGFSDDGVAGQKLEAESAVGGSISVNPPKNSHLAMGREKIGWRKKTDSPEKVLKHFDKYFEKMRKAMKKHESDIYNRKIYPDKYFK